MERYTATGKRKSAIAIVILTEGNGKKMVNGKKLETYFTRIDLLKSINVPFEVTKTEGKFSLSANITGGGISGQADALKLGIARALLKFNPDLRKALKSHGLLRRDPREKERKKYGRVKARKGFQWTKR
jgi:small subunit ribosomal protein S9